MDEVMLQLRLAAWRGEEATLERIGLRYMLQGGPGVDEQGRQSLGPHIMISLPANVPIADWIGRALQPNGPWVDVGPEGAVITIPVAAPGATLR
jgi:hypothetical protein